MSGANAARGELILFMKNARWLLALMLVGALVVAYKFGQRTESQKPDVKLIAQRRVTVTYDASQYAPEAFEETNCHFQEAVERGDYPKGIVLICGYPSGLGGDTIVVAGSHIPEVTSEAIFEAVRKSLDEYPRIARFELEESPDQEQTTEAEQVAP